MAARLSAESLRLHEEEVMERTKPMDSRTAASVLAFAEDLDALMEEAEQSRLPKADLQEALLRALQVLWKRKR